MPTYDYLCKNCEHKFEEFQSITASPLKKCPKCGKNTLQRLIGMGAALIFKGSGFYATDYRSETYNNCAKSDTSKSSSSSESKKTETAKTESTTTTTSSNPASESKTTPASKTPKAEGKKKIA